MVPFARSMRRMRVCKEASPVFLSGLSSGLCSPMNRYFSLGERATPSKPRFPLRVSRMPGSVAEMG